MGLGKSHYGLGDPRGSRGPQLTWGSGPDITPCPLTVWKLKEQRPWERPGGLDGGGHTGVSTVSGPLRGARGCLDAQMRKLSPGPGLPPPPVRNSAVPGGLDRTACRRHAGRGQPGLRGHPSVARVRAPGWDRAVPYPAAPPSRGRAQREGGHFFPLGWGPEHPAWTPGSQGCGLRPRAGWPADQQTGLTLLWASAKPESPRTGSGQLVPSPLCLIPQLGTGTPTVHGPWPWEQRLAQGRRGRPWPSPGAPRTHTHTGRFLTCQTETEAGFVPRSV